MLESILAFVVGAIFGVIADRAWRRIEARPQFELTCAYFANVEREEGLTYRVRNVGVSPIPDYRLILFHRDRGSISAFQTDGSGPLLPGQAREHRVVQLRHGEPERFLLSWFWRVRNEPVEEVELEGFSFRIVMHHSDRMLLESETIGNALAREFVRTLRSRHAGQMTYEETLALNTPRPRGLRRHWYWLLNLLALRQKDTDDVRRC